MNKKLNVDWVKLKELSNKTKETSVEFENSRMNFQNIIKSLEECWTGSDARNFIANSNNFLESLKTLYHQYMLYLH